MQESLQSRTLSEDPWNPLCLYLLSQKDYYGYELSQLMDSLSDGVIKIPIGSLYPALYKLIEYGFISDHKEQVGKRMTRVYYLEQPDSSVCIFLTEYTRFMASYFIHT